MPYTFGVGAPIPEPDYPSPSPSGSEASLPPRYHPLLNRARPPLNSRLNSSLFHRKVRRGWRPRARQISKGDDFGRLTWARFSPAFVQSEHVRDEGRNTQFPYSAVCVGQLNETPLASRKLDCPPSVKKSKKPR